MTGYIPLAIYLAGFIAWLGWSLSALWLRWDHVSQLAHKHNLPEDRTTLAAAFAFMGSVWPATPFVLGYVAWRDRSAR